MTALFTNISKGDVRIVLAVMLMVMIFTVLILILTHAIPEPNQDVAYVCAGVLLREGSTVYDFYFGSSKSEVDNNEKNKN